ncbi:hypothetical protein ACFQ60_36850 [Streptomyces zhihengii]
MAELSGLKRGRTRARLVAAATAAALLITGAAAGSASAADSSPSATAVTKAPAKKSLGIQAEAQDAPVNALYGVNSSGVLYGYPPNGAGGIDTKMYSGEGWGATQQMTQVDHDADGSSDGIWFVEGGRLYHLFYGEDATDQGGGWGPTTRSSPPPTSPVPARTTCSPVTPRATCTCTSGTATAS